jgi:hypothetical protein
MSKIYCGDKPNLPGNKNYVRFGTRNECLKCGFGSAMYKYRWAPADNQPRPQRRTKPGCLRPRTLAQGNVRGNQFNRHVARRSHPAAHRTHPAPKPIYSHEFQVNPHLSHSGSRYSPARHLDRVSSTWSIAMGIFASVVAFVLLYKFPPHCITKREKNKDVIDWKKFSVVYALIIVCIVATVTLIHLV